MSSACTPRCPSALAVTAAAAFAAKSTASSALASTVSARASPATVANRAERGDPLLDKLRIPTLPNLLWRAGRLLQARPSLGRSGLRLRPVGMQRLLLLHSDALSTKRAAMAAATSATAPSSAASTAATKAVAATSATTAVAACGTVHVQKLWPVPWASQKCEHPS
jgi:hypothetical protein